MGRPASVSSGGVSFRMAVIVSAVVSPWNARRPLSIDYDLTEVGATLAPRVRALKAWAEEHLAYVEQSHVAFDGRRRP